MNDRITVSIDIGGTFTDIVAIRGSSIVRTMKLRTVTSRPDEAVAEGLKQLGMKKVDDFLHATTIATNTLLGQKGLPLPKVGLITTRGFADVIEIARQNRPSLYDLNFERPRQLVRRNMRFEIDERTLWDGAIEKTPSADDVENVIAAIKKGNAGSVAIVFLNSFSNDSNEHAVAEFARKQFRHVSVSSEIAPEPREYERTSTTVVNAVLKPGVADYLSRIEELMKLYGGPSVSIMSSSGGLIPGQTAISRPVAIVESGPAAGVIAAAEFARQLQIGKAVSFDMGGTTAKAGSIDNYRAEITSEYEVGGKSHHGRLIKGSGYPIRMPFVDLAEVSAGGGTMVWKDASGAINVGPESAGSDPGPACYGTGGTIPTITDANLILGYINDRMPGNGLLKRDLAVKAFRRLGDPYAIARAALDIVNLEMARAIRLVTVERGLDPKDFTLIAFGGGGPQHAASVCTELGISKFVIPPEPAVFSALGLLQSDMKFELTKSFPENVEKSFQRMKEDLEREHEGATFEMYADCRYRGQGSEISFPVGTPSNKAITSEFKRLHLATYGFNLEREVEIFNIRVFAMLPRRKISFSVKVHSETKGGSRVIHLKDSSLDTRVFARESLSAKSDVIGPALVDEIGSTTVIPEGWKATVGEYGELSVMRLK